MPPRPARSYMICTVPRSGSTLLCRMLAATGVAGHPGSHFHTPSLERWLQVYGLDAAAFASRRDQARGVFDAAIARGMGDTDTFGLRMQRGSFDHFLETLALLAPDEPDDAARIGAVFGPTVFVHLTRPDRLGQAISRLRAEQTGLWHRHSDGSELERLSPHRDPQYDADAIARHMTDLAALDAGWEQWFDRQKIDPVRIAYDDLSEDPRRALARVLSAIGLDARHARGVDIPTARLADDESRRWRLRFERERPGASAQEGGPALLRDPNID